MSIAQTVYDICELSKNTKIPFLMVSNPGAGKTTGAMRYAEKNGYHLEVLIGSRSTPEELLGYQVNNGGSSLEHLDSQWWARIIEYEKKGIPSILFCDEISTCPGQTEGAMLSLIQDRKNQKGESLPESCIVLGAANYSKNLPSYMDIIAPAINRFCVINLMDNMNGLDLVSELFHPEMNEAYPREYTPFTEKENAEYSSTMEKFFTNLFTEYSDPKSSKGFIDITNTDIAGLYQDSEKGLYNFISLRSMNNMIKLLKSALEYGMTSKGFLSKIVDGLIGAGSCSFTEVKQAQMYRDTLHSSVDSISRKFAKKESFIKAKKSFDYGEDNVANIVSKLNMMSEEVNDFIDENKENKEIACLVNAVEKNYGDIGETLVELNNNTENRAKFLSDYEAVGEFFDKNESKLESEQAHDLAIFLQKYTAYYAQLGKGRYLSDVNKMRVFKNYKSSLYFCSLLAVDPRINVENIEKDGVKKLVKNGDIIEVGIRRISDKTPYKIPYNSSVSANNLGTPVTDKMLLVFENGKLVKVSPLDIKNA